MVWAWGALAWLWLGRADAVELTLAEALTTAFEGNQELQVAWLQRRDAVLALQGAQGAFDPELGVGVQLSGARSPTNAAVDGVPVVISSSVGWDVGLSQSLPTGGSVQVGWSEWVSQSNSLNQNEPRFATTSLSASLSHPLLRGAGTVSGMAGVLAARLNTTDQELAWRGEVEQLVLDVSGAYWALVSARESEVLARRSVELAEEQLRETQERFEEGFVGTGDVLQLQRTLGQARQGQVVAVAEVQSASERLARLLGWAIGEHGDLVPVDRPLVPEVLPQRDEVIASAQARNTSWRRAQLAVERSTLSLRQARNGVLPDLSASASLGLAGLGSDAAEARAATFEEPSPAWGVGFRLNMPVALRSQRAELGSAELNRQQADLWVDAAEQDLLIEVERGLRAVERDRSRLALAQDTLTYAQLGLEADSELLADGRGAARDVVRSLEALREAQVGKLAAEIDLQISLLALSRVAGTLLETMVLPVEVMP
jgi:outer membrane protein TolC